MAKHNVTEGVMISVLQRMPRGNAMIIKDDSLFRTKLT